MLEDGALGCIVRPGNAPALAEALSRLLQEPDRRRRMAEADFYKPAEAELSAAVREAIPSGS